MAAINQGASGGKYLPTILALLLLLGAGCATAAPRLDVQKEMTYVCGLLGVDGRSVPLPKIIWVNDSFAATELFDSLTHQDLRVAAFYSPANNAIVLPIREYSNVLLWHELAHAVMSHNPRWQRTNQEGWATLAAGQW
jgi:hypothetical protein